MDEPTVIENWQGIVLVSKLATNPVQVHKLVHTEGRERQEKEADPSRLVGGSFNKQGNSQSLSCMTPACQNLKILYRDF